MAVLVILGLCVGVSLSCAIKMLLCEMEPWIKHTERRRFAVGMDFQYLDGQHPVRDLLLRTYGEEPSALSLSDNQITEHQITVIEPTVQIFKAAMQRYNASSFDVFVNFNGLTVYLVHEEIFNMVKQHDARYKENFVHDDTLWGQLTSGLNFKPRMYHHTLREFAKSRNICVPANMNVLGVFCPEPHAVYVALTKNDPILPYRHDAIAVGVLVHEVSHALFSTMDLYNEPISME